MTLLCVSSELSWVFCPCCVLEKSLYCFRLHQILKLSGRQNCSQAWHKMGIFLCSHFITPEGQRYAWWSCLYLSLFLYALRDCPAQTYFSSGIVWSIDAVWWRNNKSHLRNYCLENWPQNEFSISSLSRLYVYLH